MGDIEQASGLVLRGAMALVAARQPSAVCAVQHMQQVQPHTQSSQMSTRCELQAHTSTHARTHAHSTRSHVAHARPLPAFACPASHTCPPHVHQAARVHPYVVKPSAGRMASWAGGACLGAVLGVCCINPDGGDMAEWLPQVQAIIDRHQPAFAAAGCQLSLQRAQQSHWVQIDINPNMAVGQPGVGVCVRGEVQY